MSDWTPPAMTPSKTLSVTGMWDDVLLEHVMRNNLLTPLDFETLKDRYIQALNDMPEISDIKSEDIGEMMHKLADFTNELSRHDTVEAALRHRHGA